MFRAIGVVIIIYSLSIMLDSAFNAFESATVSVLSTVEVAADISAEQLQKIEKE